MGTLDIMNAVKSILVAAVPDLMVKKGIPVHGSQGVYFFHEASHDVRKAHNQTERHHIIPFCIALLSNSGTSDRDEDKLASYIDSVSDLFYVNHTLNGTVRDCTCRQADGQHANRTPYLLIDNAEFRACWWTLEAIEQRMIVETD
jgi:hypothetical protein